MLFPIYLRYYCRTNALKRTTFCRNILLLILMASVETATHCFVEPISIQKGCRKDSNSFYMYLFQILITIRMLSLIFTLCDSGNILNHNPRYPWLFPMWILVLSLFLTTRIMPQHSFLTWYLVIIKGKFTMACSIWRELIYSVNLTRTRTLSTQLLDLLPKGPILPHVHQKWVCVFNPSMYMIISQKSWFIQGKIGSVAFYYF